MYFQEDPTFFNFPETQVGGFGPPEPPNTNPPLYFIPSPRFNFTFGYFMNLFKEMILPWELQEEYKEEEKE